MQKLCQLPGWYGRRKSCAALWSALLRPEARLPQLASRPEISGGKKGIFIIQLFWNTHTHTRQTNHYIAHLQVDYQIGTTVHIVEIRPYLWSHFNSFFPRLHFFHLVWQKFLQFFPVLHFFSSSNIKDRSCSGDVLGVYFVERMRATMSP